jgi:hypothetical protein
LGEKCHEVDFNPQPDKNCETIDSAFTPTPMSTLKIVWILAIKN